MTQKTKRTLALGLAAAAGVTLLAGLDARLVVRTYAIESEQVSTPVRLAVLTDLHACAYGEGQKNLLDVVAVQSPDLVLLCGDIVDDDPRMPEERALATVEALAEVWPVYYVTGNHEFWTGRVEEVRELLRARGAVVLEGESAAVTAAGQTLRIGGIDDPSVGEDIWREQLETVTAAQDGETFSILLTHRPERVEDYTGRGFDLVLAGHAHGGQWRLPGLINGLIAPNQGLFPRYAGGRYALDGDTTMIVSRGLARESGGGHPAGGDCLKKPGRDQEFPTSARLSRLLQGIEGFLIVLNVPAQVFPPTLHHGVALGLQPGPLGLHAAGVFGVEFPARLQGAPVGDLVLRALVAGPGGDGDEDPRRHGVGEVGAARARQARSSPVVVSFPAGTRRMRAS